jgi:hypothetical protein
MPVKPAGTAGLSLKDHEGLAQALLLARAHVARVAAQVRGDGLWSRSRGVAHTLELVIREIDRGREELSAALAAEHPVVHPALARRIYFPVVDGREERNDVTPRSES